MVFQVPEVPWRTINPPKLIPIITLKLCIDKTPSKVRFVSKHDVSSHLKLHPKSLKIELGSPRRSSWRSEGPAEFFKASPGSQNLSQKAVPGNPNTAKTNTKSQVTSPSYLGGAGGRGRSPQDSPHPLQGEHGVLDLLKNLQYLKLQAASPPAAGPCPKSPKIHLFSDLRKWQAQIEKKCSQQWPRGSILDVIFHDFSVFLHKMFL